MQMSNTGADISSDHSLVLCNLKLRLKRIPQKKYQMKRNVEAIEIDDIRERYENEINARIDKADMEYLDMDRKVTVLNEIIYQAVESTIPLAEKPNKKWITEGTLKL